MDSTTPHKSETEQELLTTSAELKEQFNEIQANWEMENKLLRARIAYLEDEFMDLGAGRREVDRQTVLLDIRNTLKHTIRNMYGWEYAILMFINGNMGEDTIGTKVLGRVWDDVERNREVLAYAVKHNFQTDPSKSETPYASPEEREFERSSAREIRQKIAKDSS